MTTTARSDAVQPTTKLDRKGRKAIIAGSIGNAVEFVDWAVYDLLVHLRAPLLPAR